MAGLNLKLGDRVRVIKVKFSDLHPKNFVNKFTDKNQKYTSRSSKIIGHEGVIVHVRENDDFETEYEKENKTVEKYQVSIDTVPDKIEKKRKKQWIGVKYYWPEELELI